MFCLIDSIAKASVENQDSENEGENIYIHHLIHSSFKSKCHAMQVSLLTSLSPNLHLNIQQVSIG